MTKARRVLILWFVVGVLAVPVVTLLHEAGHYTVSRMMGWTGEVIHYSSAGPRNGEPDSESHPAWQAALVSIAGPVVSIFVIFIGAYVAKREALRPIGTALGVSAGPRFYAPALTAAVIILRRMRNMQTPFHPVLDEYSFGQQLGISPLIPLLLSFAVALVGFFLLGRTVWGRTSAISLAAMALGTVAGAVIYFKFLGPAILP
jgi:hypothetical protein